jgi:EmrB/QacA subfamily drug resistance transporter
MSDGFAQMSPATAAPAPVRRGAAGGAAAVASASASANGWVTLWAVNIGTFMTTLDTSIVNISLPAIARAFRMPVGGAVEWVIIAYLLVIAATLVSFGRWSDLVGRKSIYTAGLALFVIGSACCGAAPSLPLLVAARAFQGLGGAMILSTAQAIIADSFPPQRRGRAIGWNSVVIAIGFTAGPTLGGLITHYFDWRWVFYVNVPIGAIALIVSHGYLRASAGAAAARTPTGSRFDLVGAGMFAVAFVTSMLALSFGQSWGWTSVRVLSCATITAAAIWNALRVERCAARPVVDLRLLGNGIFGEALLSAFLATLAAFSVSFILPLYFEQLRGFAVNRAGLLMSALPLTIVLVAPLSGTLADRVGSRGLAGGGLLLVCVGLALLTTLSSHSTPLEIVGPLIVTGIGQGLFQSPNTRTMLNAAPATDEGEASGLIATSRVLAQSVAVAVAGSIFAAMGGSAAGRALAATAAIATPDARQLQTTFLTAFRTTLFVCALTAGIGVVLTLRRRQRQDRTGARSVELFRTDQTTRSLS